MTMNWVMGILGGLVFASVGIGGLIFSSKKKFHFFLPLLIGSWLLHVHTFGPLSKSGDKLEEIIKLNSSDVQLIILKPTKRKGQKDISLIQNELLIEDKDSIEKICLTLNKAKKTYSGYIKSAEWLAQVEIKKEYENIKFGIRKRGSKTSLNVYSDGEYGWNYGTLKCNELGKVLEGELEK